MNTYLITVEFVGTLDEMLPSATAEGTVANGAGCDGQSYLTFRVHAGDEDGARVEGERLAALCGPSRFIHAPVRTDEPARV